MSLSKQILYRIFVSALCILVLGGALVVWQARQAVADEVDSSVRLALQLISIGFAGEREWPAVTDLSRFGALQQTRHLSILLRKPDGQLLHFPGEHQPSHPEKMPPAWFVRVVKGDYPQLEQQLQTRDGQTLTLIIKPQPLDEISEVWKESLWFFASISLLTLLTLLAVNLVLNRSLLAIRVIVSTLEGIETGNYRQHLPPFATREFDSIAKAVNHLMQELEHAQQQNRALTQHSLAVIEDERQRLSQELHDELGQSLTAIKAMAVTAGRQAPEVTRITAAIGAVCDQLLGVVRSMMQQLHPLVLTELGLRAALEDILHYWPERHPEIRLRIDCYPGVDELEPRIGVQVFRVIQECLTNVLRHAGADSVSVSLRRQEQPRALLCLEVCDNGSGCDPAASARGFGLQGIRERIRSLGGELQLISQPGAGMTVSAQVPLP